ncbi:hypothetical protein M892_28700 (plasmid) [Vibrio campbellii ATCC BAA-1116]|uniref:Uncharacterized protein n=1 Tax=Vibrio campbellii (strain ATCC BAA-1116) TaxID=2902295 RepID=A7N8Y3_VIBC1|nr:hypothetical protein VIBHAR_p08264 [Vibrio campbellii ATCC BAA-1116]AGU99105.1 hypothetical protein M892_28700 [Vibrio campbellii ATCC BAA-1116]
MNKARMSISTNKLWGKLVLELVGLTRVWTETHQWFC